MVKNSRDLKNITLEDKVYKTIVDNNLIQNEDKIVVGVSGGPDSICLLTVLNNLKEQFKKENNIYYELVVAHINHGLRKEADEEQQFVKEYCDKLAIKFYYIKSDIKKISSEQKISDEMCGRKIRYEFFSEILNKEKASKIAVAHNQDDNVETILLNLSRGTGLKGLTGILYQNKNIIRPLLDIPKKEINEYCNINNLNPRIDKSNFSDVYLRNRVRLNVLPALKQNFGENICDSILRTRKILIKEDEFLSQYTNNIINNAIIENTNESIVFKSDIIMVEHDAIKLRCIRRLLEIALGNLQQISLNYIEDILNLLKAGKKGKTFIVGNKFRFEIIDKNISKIIKLGEKI